MSVGLYLVADAISAIGAAAEATAAKLEDAAAAAQDAAAGLSGNAAGGGMGSSPGGAPGGGGLSGAGPSWISAQTVPFAQLIKALKSLDGRSAPGDMGSG